MESHGVTDESVDNAIVEKLTDQLLPRLRAATVPLFYIREEYPANPIQVGSGTLFRVAGVSFLVTAAHVYRIMVTHGGGLYTHDLADGSEFVPLNGKYHFDVEQDLAVIALSELQVDALPNREYLSIQCTDRLLRGFHEGWYVIHGYPNCWSLVELEAQTSVVRPYTRIVRLFAGKTHNLENYDEGRHRLLDHAHGKSLTPSTLKEDLPECVSGISGSSIWRLIRDGDPTERWDLENAQIVGTETHVYKDGRIVRGTRWAFVHYIIWKCFPELRGPLNIVIPERAPPNGDLEGLVRISI
jgi:hypothetical protein